jgi:hypothetical protein
VFGEYPQSIHEIGDRRGKSVPKGGKALGGVIALHQQLQNAADNAAL